MLIVEDPTVTVKCRTAINTLVPLLWFVPKCSIVSPVYFHPYLFLLSVLQHRGDNSFFISAKSGTSIYTYMKTF